MKIDIAELMTQIENSEHPVSIQRKQSTAYSIKRRIQKCMDSLSTIDNRYCDKFVEMHYDKDSEKATFEYVS